MWYTRTDVTGKTCFFTVNLAEREKRLLMDHMNVLRMVMKKVKSMHPFHIDAMVVLGDHLRSIWTIGNDYRAVLPKYKSEHVS